jgi:MFS family permease
MMGVSRTLYAFLSEKIKLKTFMLFSAGLCVLSYLIAVLSPFPILSLVGCGLCGFSVGIMWPGTISIASKKIPRGGTALFALLAVFGDVGATIGPATVGFVSGAFNDDLKKGLACIIIFPVIMIIGNVILAKKKAK